MAVICFHRERCKLLIVYQPRSLIQRCSPKSIGLLLRQEICVLNICLLFSSDAYKNKGEVILEDYHCFELLFV